MAGKTAKVYTYGSPRVWGRAVVIVMAIWAVRYLLARRRFAAHEVHPGGDGHAEPVDGAACQQVVVDGAEEAER